MKQTILSIIIDGIIAVVVALGLIALPRMFPGLPAGHVLVPAFVAWWILSYRSAVPQWWMVLVIILVDVFTFTPRGGLTVSFIPPALALILLDRFLPLGSFLSAVVRAAVAVLLFELTVASILFVSLAPAGSPFPWSTFGINSAVNILTAAILLGLLWNFRKRRAWLW